MARKTSAQSFSDHFWSDSPDSHLFSSPSSSSLNQKKNQSYQRDLLSSVDESPEFHDPYSDLSLFLSHTIKKEMKEIAPSASWTTQLQEDLLSKITPEFQKKFPQYRLGVSAVKKIWNKIVFYMEQIQEKSEALDSEGKLNINFFIKENLRQYFQNKAASFLSPYQCAYQIASKMSECIATLEGTKPKLDLLTQIVFSLQKHLQDSPSTKQTKTPYEEFDKIDKLIVKTILEISAKHPHMECDKLKHATKETLQALHDLPDFSSTDKITCNVSAILAERLYSTSSFHFLFFAEQKEAIYDFIKKHSRLYKTATVMPYLPDLVRRLIALYALATQMPKNLPESAFYEAVEATHFCKAKKTDIDQFIYAFISAELLLVKKPSEELSLEELQRCIFESYKKLPLLPTLQQINKEELEVVIWKILSETEGFLEKLPYRIGQRIEEEIAAILIDNPSKNFASIVHETVQFFKQAKELTETKKWKDIDKKIHLWSIQSDMLCRSIRLQLDSPLSQMIQAAFEKKKLSTLCHFSFISEVCQQFLQKFPSATIYLAQLSTKAWILYKYMWYTKFAKETESSFDRFLLWHICFLKKSHQDNSLLIKQLEDLCKKCLPLIPFDEKQALSALACFPKDENPA